MEIQSTNFTQILFLFGEYAVERKYYDEKDTDLNHRLCSARR